MTAKLEEFLSYPRCFAANGSRHIRCLWTTRVGFMATLRLSLSMLTAAAQYSCFPPTIVRRRIEAIRRKRACWGSALSLSSERGWIG